MEIPDKEKSYLIKMGFVLLVVWAVYLAVRIYSEIKKDSLLGENATPATISFSGHGEVTAVPDIANVSFTILKDSKTVADAQAGVATVEKSALWIFWKQMVLTPKIFKLLTLLLTPLINIKMLYVRQFLFRS